MFNKIENLQNNATEANFLGYKLTKERAQQFAELIEANTSLQKIELVRCSIDDEIFAELARGILNRKIPFIHINLDLNNLTSVSFPLLKEIIKQKKCQHLMFYGNASKQNVDIRLDTHEKEMNELQELADSGDFKVALHFENPINRSYKGFFELLRQDQLSKFKNPQEETKEEPKHYQNGP